jgi:hypothetical protein
MGREDPGRIQRPAAGDKLIPTSQPLPSERRTLMAFLSWRELDEPLRVTLLTGILAGFGGIRTTIALQYQPVDHSAPPISFIFVIGSFFSLAGAFCLLWVPVNRDQRGIVGLVTFVVSVSLLPFALPSIVLLVPRLGTL